MDDDHLTWCQPHLLLARACSTCVGFVSVVRVPPPLIPACPVASPSPVVWHARYDEMIDVLTPRSMSRQATPEGSPRGGEAPHEASQEEEAVGQGIFDDIIGGIGKGFDRVTETIGKAGGALKFWEGDGSKSPRHHFDEGRIFKGMFGNEETEDATVPFTAMKKPGVGGEAKADPEAEAIVPCLRQPGAPCSKPDCRVLFKAVLWRNHHVEMDGSGGLPSSGIPLGIGWKVDSDRELSLDEFESEREGVRRDRDEFMMSGFVTPKERVEVFVKAGYTKEQISSCELATFKTNRRRKASVQDLSDMEF